MTADVTIGSWNEYCDFVYGRDSLCYRGASKAAYDLKATLHRKSDNAKDLERKILSEFIQKNKQWSASEHESIVSVMIRAQHYGAPTRLLDWTFSPLVALHFAISQNHEDDAAVWMLDCSLAVGQYPQLLSRAMNPNPRSVLSERDIELLDVTLNDVPGVPSSDVDMEFMFHFLDRIEWFQDPFLLLIEPDHHDSRISAQASVFAMMSKVDAHVHSLLQSRVPLCKKLIIPARLKTDFRKRLDISNVTERTLFPGSDGLGRFLSRSN